MFTVLLLLVVKFGLVDATCSLRSLDFQICSQNSVTLESDVAVVPGGGDVFVTAPVGIVMCTLMPCRVHSLLKGNFINCSNVKCCKNDVNVRKLHCKLTFL